MTFPTRSTITGHTEPADTSHDVVMPASVALGDLLVVQITIKDATLTWDDSTVGAWTLFESEGPQGGLRHYTFTRFADGNEDGQTLAVTSSSASRAAWKVDKFTGAGSIEKATAVLALGTPNSPALDPSWGTEDVYWFTTLALRAESLTNPPLNYQSERARDTSGGGTGGVSISTGYRQLNAASQDPRTWGISANHIVNTYAVRSGATLFPPRLDVGVTFFAPSVRQIIAPPRLNVGVQFFAPRVASLQVLAPPRLDVGVTFFAPFVGSGLLATRLDVGVTFFPPTILKPGTLEPPRLDVGVTFFAPLVEGGFRPLPVFNRVSFGPFPGAIGDAALGAIITENFESRWSIRGPIGFTNFAPFVASMYEFDEAYVWLRLMLDVGAVPAIAITQALMHIDVPDTRDSGEAEIGIGGDWVNFVRTFNAPPDVVAQVITASGVTQAPKATVRDDIETGRFFVTCHTGDDTADSVAARIKWIAQGF